MAVQIRPETDDDRESIRDVNRAAFESEAEVGLVDALRDGRHVTLSLVAVVDGTIVGHILFSRLSIASNTERLDAVSLGPMSVLPTHQRQGVGTRLVESGLEACRQQDDNIVLVLGHPAFYPRFGFSAKLALPLHSVFGGGDPWMAAELAPGALDGVSGQVTFAPPFSAFE
jgi:putative acetyltransferase